VLLRNAITGQDEAKTVTATIKRLAPAVVTVSLQDANTGQTESLTCSPEHLFFVQGQGWVEAGSLGIGTSIVSRTGPALSVTNVTWKRDQSKELAAGISAFPQGGYIVYILTVEDDHTYFVGTTGGGTWVHNVNCTELVKVPNIKGTDLFNRVRDALKGRIPLSNFSPEDLESAAQHYEQIGFEKGGKSSADLARAYQFARAAYLSGQGPMPPDTALKFGEQLLGGGE